MAQSIFIFCGIILAFASIVFGDAHVQPPCAEGYTIACDRTCYKIVRGDKKNYDDSRAACEALGGKLAAIRNAEEQACLAASQDADSYDHLWFGLYAEPNAIITDVANWKWVDSTVASGGFQNWAVSGEYREPNDPRNEGVERCGELTFDPNYRIDEDAEAVHAKGLWNNMPCDGVRDYICEKSRA